MVGVSVYIVRDGRFLIGERIGAHGAHTWATPGGHLEYGEGWEECARREVLEETGVRIRNVRYFGITNDVFGNNKHYITIAILADWESGEAEILEPDKCLGWRWVSLKEMPKRLFLPVENLMKSDFVDILREGLGV